MEKLAKYFSVQLSNRNYTSGKMNYVFSVSTENKLQKVVEYFNKFPLMSSKYLNNLD